MFLTDSERSSVTNILATVSTPVQLLFFEQSIGCDTCPPTRRLLEQFVELSAHLSLDTHNLVLDKDLAREYSIDRAPAIVVSGAGGNRIRFYGAPFGGEILSLARAIQMTGTGATELGDRSRDRLTSLSAPVDLKVFFTPTCVYCPQMVTLANRLAVESPFITATAIDATEFPDLVAKYNVNGVPKIVINDTQSILGVASEDDVITAIC